MGNDCGHSGITCVFLCDRSENILSLEPQHKLASVSIQLSVAGANGGVLIKLVALYQYPQQKFGGVAAL